MSKFESMGKEELRAACRVAGVSYSKLNNAGMREVLRAAEAATVESASVELADVTEDAVHAPFILETLEAAEQAKQARKAVVTAATNTSGKGIKIEKEREERNGIKRPSVGGTCRAIWDAMDELVAQGETPTAKIVRSMATEYNWNENNASIEFYQWRKFNGIRGRQ